MWFYLRRVYLRFFRDLLVFMICSVTSRATPPPALGTSSCFFYLACHMSPLVSRVSLLLFKVPSFPLCQGILPKKWFPYDKGSCMLVGSVGLSLVARALPCGKGCQKHWNSLLKLWPKSHRIKSINIFGKKINIWINNFWWKKRKISILWILILSIFFTKSISIFLIPKYWS